MAAVHVSDLPTYLEKVTFRKVDCCVFVADWLVENGLPDPMADRRGTYTRHQWTFLLESEGGIVAACSKRLAAIGLRETSVPVAGDVALVIVPTGHGTETTGAICTSAAMRAVVGVDVALAIATPPTVKAWRLPRA